MNSTHNKSLEPDRFDIGAGWFKYAAIKKIEEAFAKPSCRKKEVCVHELSLPDYVCVPCAKWSSSQKIISIIKEIS